MILDQKKKLFLKRPSQAVVCNEDYGPIFGNCDLVIFNQADRANNYSNFPASFNTEDNAYLFNQIAATELIGSPSSRNFKVVEY